MPGKTGNNMMDGYPVELADECSSKEQVIISNKENNIKTGLASQIRLEQ